ncbi:MAG: ABC-2 transporter permease, partial [Planctomycetota bacterium]
VADRVEIWLTQVLADDDIRQALATEEPMVLERLRNFEGRQTARRRAILVSWMRDSELEWDETIHGVSPLEFWFRDVPQGYRRSIMKQGMGAVTSALLALLESGNSGEDTTPARRRLNELIHLQSIDFDLGPYGDRNRSITRRQSYRRFENIAIPGIQWFGDWEYAFQERQP